jgi:hypothetical protein
LVTMQAEAKELLAAKPHGVMPLTVKVSITGP